MASAVSNLKSAGGGNERFNAEAASWDSRPFVHAASREAADAILAQLKTHSLHKATNDLNVLEIGCGTGILSFLLAPHVQRVVAVDAAEGMIDVLNQKLHKPNAPSNITPVAVLLENPEDPALPPARPQGSDASGDATARLKFDLITSHLVLHHIPDLAPVLRTMHGCLKNGGSVMLTDFQDFAPEARRFHPESKMDGVARHGIQVEQMTQLMRDAGFAGVEVKTAWRMMKTVEKFPGEFGTKGGPGEGQGEEMEIPFVMCYGQKPGQMLC
ncbi:Hypothetical protein R9X50_00013800 [Acrodontium crateriforme]|uniref:S-adenosyl-L-methionine-dependent methyltransferase n=1 Tax=Acrodontium crateriforme TaxID=150365 RepID=A0AAQ3LWQ1_9PEZI|nr:Hypothetical protein R9X50_00013800 [Acrodontium crateriforme]